ncbi:hypothetical protein [Bosea sp. PAMC 26642]|uniref:hypothetical protein n=1 Tax=Bosea sp. (strain PAMC 26642) TaxID=1792307 RepID=UPI000770179A|nr:hypothetical protein [Bosea sp. PAMC 26642]AMJ63043.1 hypothetical protein AXW83_24530 [Bosea sp. PAMC 26642]
MSGTVHEFAAGQQARLSAQSQSPPLPIEKHIVSAALAAERVRALAAQMLLVLQHAPRDAAMVDRLQDDIIAAWSDIYDHHGAYRAVIECEGQA